MYYTRIKTILVFVAASALYIAGPSTYSPHTPHPPFIPSHSSHLIPSPPFFFSFIRNLFVTLDFTTLSLHAPTRPRERILDFSCFSRHSTRYALPFNDLRLYNPHEVTKTKTVIQLNVAAPYPPITHIHH